MAHVVKCLNCGEKFDRDKIPCIQIGRRYAHAICPDENATNENVEFQLAQDAFYESVKKVYGPKYNFFMIQKQALNFMKEYGYSWSGMKKTFDWFYFIKHGDPLKGHEGIGIIPYVYDQAKEYYYNLYLVQQENKTKSARAPVHEVTIQSPRVFEQPPHLLDLDEGDND